MRNALIVNIVALALSACATTGSDAAKVPLDPLAGAAQTGALGSIVRYRDGQALRRASWDEARIATGSGAGPAVAKYLRTADGFRMDGRWFGAGVRMVLTRDVMTAQGRDFRRGADGAYVNPDFPGTRIVLEGDAARLDDPPWPYLALAALAMQWGEGETLWTPP